MPVFLRPAFLRLGPARLLGARSALGPAGRRAAGQQFDHHVGAFGLAHRLGEAIQRGGANLERGLLVEDADDADVLAGHVAAPADQRQQPFGIGIVAAPDIQPEPGAAGARALEAALGRAVAHIARLAGIGDFLRGGQAGAIEPHQRRRQMLGRMRREQRLAGGDVFFVRLFSQQRVAQHALMIELADLLDGGRARPFRRDAEAAQHVFHAAAAERGHQQHAHALAPGAPGAPAAVLQAFRVIGQVGMDDEAEIGQVDAARGDVGGDTDARATVAQRLQRVIAFALAQFARQRDGGELPLLQRGVQVAHRLPRVAEHDGAGRIVEAQQIDDGVLDFSRRDADGAIFDVGMAAFCACHLDAQRIALVALGERRDAARHGGGEQKAPPLRRRGVEDEFEILAEAEIEHLVRLVENDDAQGGDIQPATLQMVAQASGRADHDVGALIEHALLLAGVHAADAGDDARPCRRIQPGELALHLKREFARGGDDQRLRRARGPEALFGAEQCLGRREAVGDRLARTGLCGHQQVAPSRLGCEHGALNGGGFAIVSLGEGAGERRVGGEEGQGLVPPISNVVRRRAEAIGKGEGRHLLAEPRRRCHACGLHHLDKAAAAAADHVHAARRGP